MEGIAEIGNTITMTSDILHKYTANVVEIASKAAVAAYRKIELQKRNYSVSEIAEIENCSNRTVLNWINTGIHKGTTKLKAHRKGDRDFIVNGADLELFRISRSK